MKSIGLSVPQVTEVASMLQKDGATFKQTVLTIDEMVEAICQLK
jgi:energy-coupling factor transport system ATP-binding protein